MQVTFNAHYILSVTSEELNLIGLALCKRLKPDQYEPANELNKRLLEQKILAHQQMVSLAQKALESVSKEET